MEADSTVTLYNFYGWLHANRKRVVAGAIVVAVISAVVAFVMWNNGQKEEAANNALLAVPSLIGGALPGDPASTAALLNISQQYAGTSAGITAQLLAARELFLGGKYADAQREFTKFAADHPGHPLAPQATFGIAASLEAQGKIGDAIQQYKKINVVYASDPNLVFPVKLTLGRLSEADNKPVDAVNYYKELASVNDPNDPWVVEAYERLRLLVAKHPELNPNPPQAQPATPSSLLTPSGAETELLTPPGNLTPAPQPPAAPATNQNPQATPPPVPGGRSGGEMPAPATNNNPPVVAPATNSTPAGNR
jgi:predicted negative regulator of RcsB-dependent stress response